MEPDETKRPPERRQAGFLERSIPAGGLAVMVAGAAELRHGSQSGELVAAIGAGLLGGTVIVSIVADVVHDRRARRSRY